MKRFLHLICLLAVAALLPAALIVSRGLPADSHPYVEKKYAGWNGVLRAWVCAEWKCSGSFVRWLNACAADFEKHHDGVYIEFTPVDADALQEIGTGNLRPPELLLFSPGAINNSAALKLVASPAALRRDLRNVGGGLSYPVAMGGYIWIVNLDLMTDAPSIGNVSVFPFDDTARSFSAASVALLSGDSQEDDSEFSPPEAGLDLGLPAAAGVSPVSDALERFTADDALSRFITGELPAVVASQAELARLIQLRDAGRGPDWTCVPAGQIAYTDQLLLLGFVEQTGDSAEERLTLAEEFGAGLLEPEAQARLADIGAFSVTGERIYSDFSPYAVLDGLLNSRELFTPSAFASALPDCKDLLWELIDGALDSNQALAQLRERLLSSPRQN